MTVVPAATPAEAVLERRPEIGLRRALGARRVHIGVQFLGESVLLSMLGGVAGIALGAAATAGYASIQGHLESILSRDGLETLERLIAHALA